MATMTFNCSERIMAVLEAIAAEQDMNKTDVLKQALRLYQTVNERLKNGEKMAFTKDGKLVDVVIIGISECI